MVVLNWSSGLDGVTLSPSSAVVAPSQFSPLSLWPSPVPPLTVAKIGEFGIYFRLDPADPTGNTFLLNNGLKEPYGYGAYRTDDLAANGTLVDHVWVIGAPPSPATKGAYVNALTSTTIRLGLGNDRFELAGRGIAQSPRAVVNFEASRGYMDRSTIDAGPGDDYVSALMPWQSIFRGGSNTNYGPGGLDVQISKGLPLEAVPFGDTLELRGSRVDWDFEFKDENGDGSVTLASILGEQDAIHTSNGNRIYGFERFRFADGLLDLVLSRQLAAGSLFGSPGYYLFGDAIAPELNSSIGADLWEAFCFNRTRLRGIRGGVSSPITVRTGSAVDTPFLQDGIAYASLFTEAGNDVVYTGSIQSARMDTGRGDDELDVGSEAIGADLAAGAGRDAFRLGSVVFSDIAMGLDGENDDDTLEIRGSLSNSTLWGGGGVDTLLINDFDPVALSMSSVTDQTGTYFLYGTTRIYGFENIGAIGAIGARVRSAPAPAPAPTSAAPPDPAAENVIEGGIGGSRTLVGTPATDLFRYSAARGLAARDEIRDFQRGTDKLLIDDLHRDSPIGRALKGATSGRLLARVRHRKDVARSRSLLVYNTRNGELSYNANGRKKGLGSGGGLIADFTPNVKLNNSDLLFSYADPLA